MSDEGIQRNDESPEEYFARADETSAQEVLDLTMSERLARLHNLLLSLGPIRGAARR